MTTAKARTRTIAAAAAVCIWNGIEIKRERARMMRERQRPNKRISEGKKEKTRITTQNNHAMEKRYIEYENRNEKKRNKRRKEACTQKY